MTRFDRKRRRRWAHFQGRYYLIGRDVVVDDHRVVQLYTPDDSRNFQIVINAGIDLEELRASFEALREAGAQIAGFR